MNKQFLSNLKRLQTVGTIVVMLFGLGLMGMSGNPVVAIFLTFLFVLGNYVITQFFISVIDLLIRIEQNTRGEGTADYSYFK